MYINWAYRTDRIGSFALAWRSPVRHSGVTEFMLGGAGQCAVTAGWSSLTPRPSRTGSLGHCRRTSEELVRSASTNPGTGWGQSPVSSCHRVPAGFSAVRATGFRGHRCASRGSKSPQCANSQEARVQPACCGQG